MTWKQQSEVQLRVIWVLKCREDKKEQAKENGEKGWMCEREIKEGKRGALIKQTPLILAVPEERFRHYSAKMPVFPLRLTQIHENTHVYAHWTKTSQHWVSDKQHRNKKKNLFSELLILVFTPEASSHHFLHQQSFSFLSLYSPTVHIQFHSIPQHYIFIFISVY